MTYYNKEWEKSYNWLKQGTKSTEAFCKTCLLTFSVGNMGHSAVRQHGNSTLHRKKYLAGNCSKQMENFFVKTDTQEELHVILIELCKIYHTIKHNQSYNSLDCSLKLDKVVYSDSKLAAKISCGRTKSEAIVQNVLGEKALQRVLDLLNSHTPKLFFCIQLDASNKNNIKLFPISVQFFTVQGGLQNFIIHFCENSDESSDGMFNMINDTLEKLNLKWELVSSLSADNTNSNF